MRLSGPPALTALGEQGRHLADAAANGDGEGRRWLGAGDGGGRSMEGGRRWRGRRGGLCPGPGVRAAVAGRSGRARGSAAGGRCCRVGTPRYLLAFSPAAQTGFHLAGVGRARLLEESGLSAHTFNLPVSLWA